MDHIVPLAAGILFALLLLASNTTFIILNRKLRLECDCKEKVLLDKDDHIDKLKKEVESLSMLYEQSEESSNKKTEFYSNITHEMKTLLSIILGSLQLIDRKRGGQPEEDAMLARNLRVINDNCYRLVRLSSNLLDLTRLDAGYMKLNPVNCELDALLDEIVRSVIPYAEQKQLVLRCSRPPEPVKTAVDIEKIERIVLNLLSNSIKFTKPGGAIDVSSYKEDGRVCIAVRDTGIGIPAGMQEEIFKRYMQAGNNPVIEKQGYGIGLSLVKSFVSLHHGDIRIISEKDRGSEFIIELPLTHVDSIKEEQDKEEQTFDEIENTTEYTSRIVEAANIEFSGFKPMAS